MRTQRMTRGSSSWMGSSYSGFSKVKHIICTRTSPQQSSRTKMWLRPSQSYWRASTGQPSPSPGENEQLTRAHQSRPRLPHMST
eukprot:scaffold91472_cov31-Tisochrysis_lutea.AAC.2